ncbi:MAG TPA: hypothetical protein VFB54_09725 [Burkholderiales bacterium]|nr:hypothetical protein [Burkholderiales bacterium]
MSKPGRFTVLSSFFVGAARVVREGEIFECDDAALIAELIAGAKIAPADRATAARLGAVYLAAWEPSPAAPRRSGRPNWARDGALRGG